MSTIKPSIMFTGGGSAGHVLPNLTLIQALTPQWRIAYLGQKQGIEHSLVRRAHVEFFAMTAGKLRRYWSWRHFIDPWKVLWGVGQALWHMRSWRPDVLFAKGGYVSVPAVLAAAILRIPVILHESDRSPGLANRICAYFAQKACLNFPLAAHHPWHRRLPLEVTGVPIRPELLSGDRVHGLQLAGLSAEKKTLLVMGGSQGAQVINEAVRETLPQLWDAGFQVIHLTGPRWLDEDSSQHVGYARFAYAHDELSHLLAASDVVLSRAGANALSELLTLRKPHILVPLGSQSSRGEQWENAAFSAQHHGSVVVAEADLISTLCEQVVRVAATSDKIIAMMPVVDLDRPIKHLIDVINTTVRA